MLSRMTLYLYLLSQSTNTSYDTFDSCVVVAESEEDAKNWHPNGNFNHEDDAWVSRENIQVTLLGVADFSLLPGVVLSSFNAG